jgi:hypothetical protein
VFVFEVLDAVEGAFGKLAEDPLQIRIFPALHEFLVGQQGGAADKAAFGFLVEIYVLEGNGYSAVKGLFDEILDRVHEKFFHLLLGSGNVQAVAVMVADILFDFGERFLFRHVCTSRTGWFSESISVESKKVKTTSRHRERR